MTVAATNMPPTGRDRHGKTPCTQGARRGPQSARSNVTASQPEKDSSAEVFCRATPVMCAPPTATSIGAHQPREEDPPPLRGQSGEVQAERGARRKPTSARSNMTASGPEQDLVAGTSRRAPPETGVKSTTATVGTRQSREEAPLLPAPVAADQAETAPKTAENRERERAAGGESGRVCGNGRRTRDSSLLNVPRSRRYSTADRHSAAPSSQN